MFNLHSNNNQSTSIKDHKRRDSVILSMPNLFRATELLYKSPITLFSTFKVEERDSETGDEFLMKSLKNEKCVAMRVRWEFDKFKTLEHPNLPQILFSELTDNYSYIVFEKLILPQNNIKIQQINTKKTDQRVNQFCKVNCHSLKRNTADK